MKKIIIAFALIVVALGGVYLIYRAVAKRAPQSAPAQSSPPPAVSVSSAAPITTPAVSPYSLVYPIKDFKNRVTKKPFGIYITLQNSPVQPERFTGYHTGADAEYEDVTADVPVFAVADGTVVSSRTASGYGGVLMIEIDLQGAKRTVSYGHIRPSSLPKIGQKVLKGEQIAFLGTGYSSETDGERRHLHFAVLSDNRLDIKGYVQGKSELSGWVDPLTLYN
jgi:murein DD-endopeptidase MepM/ murein hydrolase activator NlpD